MARSKSAMTRAVRAAVKNATHLQPEDAALVQVAMELAAVIDSAAAEDDPAAWRKQVGWVAPHLTGTLRALGLTPDTRELRDRYRVHEPDALDLLRAERRRHLPVEVQKRVDLTSRFAETKAIGAGWTDQSESDNPAG